MIRSTSFRARIALRGRSAVADRMGGEWRDTLREARAPFCHVFPFQHRRDLSAQLASQPRQKTSAAACGRQTSGEAANCAGGAIAPRRLRRRGSGTLKRATGLRPHSPNHKIKSPKAKNLRGFLYWLSRTNWQDQIGGAASPH